MNRFRGSFGLLILTGLAALLSLKGPFARAEDCPAIRLDQNGGSMSQIPVKDQGDLGICYSYTAATLFDAWTKLRLPEGSRPPHSTAPLYLATQYKLSMKNLVCPDLKENGKLEPIVNAGSVCESFDVLTGSGSCSEEALETYLRGKAPANGAANAIRARLREAEGRLEQTRASLARFKARKTSYSAENKKKLLDAFQSSVRSEEAEVRKLRQDLVAAERKPYTSKKEAIATVYTEEWLKPHCSSEARPNNQCQTCVPKGTGTEPVEAALQRELIDKMARLTLEDLKRDLDKGACAEHRWKLPVTACAPSCSWSAVNASPPNSATEESTTEKISAALRSPRALPVEASFCAAVISSADQQRVWKEKEKVALPANGSWLKHPKCGLHSALIIGQEVNVTTGACQYRLRNSWGAECGAQSVCKGRDCRCEPETGDILIDRTTFLRNLSGYSTIGENGGCK